MMIQSIIFDRNYWNITDAIKWLIKHKYKVAKIDITKNYYRFRQNKPNNKKKYYTISLKNNVKLIYNE